MAATGTPITSRCIASAPAPPSSPARRSCTSRRSNRDHICRLLKEHVAAGDTEMPGDIDPDDLPDPDDTTFGSPESVITTMVDVRDFLDRQAGRDGRPREPDPGVVVLPEDACRTHFREGFGYESFIRRGAPPGTHEDDLFAPLR